MVALSTAGSAGRGRPGTAEDRSFRRDIPADDTGLQAPAEQVRQPREDGLVVSSSTGGALTTSVAGHVFDDVERAVGRTVSPHPRHHSGASLVSRGVSAVAVSRRLGHSGPEIAYRVYAHLEPDDELAPRAAMGRDPVHDRSRVYPSCTREPSQ